MQINELTQVVESAARHGPLSGLVESVIVEPDRDEDEQDFLRVLIRLSKIEQQTEEELAAMLERIEEAVAPLDDRYPDVRFLDAA